MVDDPTKTEGEPRSFDQRLDSAVRRAGLEGDTHQMQGHPFSLAMRLSAETAVALFVAVAIGYGLDHLFGTSPWFMIGFIPIGVAAGVRNLLRMAGTTKD